jgi:hypothetical protein
MTVSMRRGEPASEDSIRRLEDRLGFRMSNQFRQFVKHNDGAEPASNMFRVGDNENGVTNFVRVSDIFRQKILIGELPKYAYPVADCECGDCVVIDEWNGGAVYFWAHEFRDPIVKIADDFNSFLSMLEPFDTSSVKVNPEDVLYVSPDTEAFRQLKAKMAERE